MSNTCKYLINNETGVKYIVNYVNYPHYILVTYKDDMDYSMIMSCGDTKPFIDATVCTEIEDKSEVDYLSKVYDSVVRINSMLLSINQ